LRLGLVAFLLTACAAPKADISPEGHLEIFGPTARIAPNTLPADWVLEGLGEAALFSSVLRLGSLDDAPTLQIASTEKGFALVRRINATLLASPFLGWSWKVSAPVDKDNPVRLIVGFEGGNSGSNAGKRESLFNFRAVIPEHDRSMALVWGGTNDVKGLIDASNATPRYFVRSGSDAANRWITENIDLSRLYRRLWPNDNLVNVRIQFVGFASGVRPVPAIAEFSDLAIYR